MTKKQIFFIDAHLNSDDPLVVQLREQEYAVYVSHSAKDALEALTLQASPDLIVACLYIAAQDNYALFQEIKNLYPDAQIILLSGHEDHDHLPDTSLIGATTILSKPLHAETLLESLNLSLADKLEGSLVAASLAQAGAFEAAEEAVTEMENLEELSSAQEETKDT